MSINIFESLVFRLTTNLAFSLEWKAGLGVTSFFFSLWKVCLIASAASLWKNESLLFFDWTFWLFHEALQLLGDFLCSSSEERCSSTPLLSASAHAAMPQPSLSSSAFAASFSASRLLFLDCNLYHIIVHVLVLLILSMPLVLPWNFFCNS